MTDMANSTQPGRSRPSAAGSNGGRLLLDAGGDDYLELRDSREADPGAVTLSRQQAQRYRDALLKTEGELLQDRQELEKNRSELSSIRQKLDGLDGQISQLKQEQAQRQRHFFYGLAALVAVGGLAWLMGRRSSLRQSAATDSVFSETGDSGVFDASQPGAESLPAPPGTGRSVRDTVDSTSDRVFFAESQSGADVGAGMSITGTARPDVPAAALPAVSDDSPASVPVAGASVKGEQAASAGFDQAVSKVKAVLPERTVAPPADRNAIEPGGTLKPLNNAALPDLQPEKAALQSEEPVGDALAHRVQGEQSGSGSKSDSVAPASAVATPVASRPASGLTVPEPQPPAAGKNEEVEAVIRDGLSAQEIDRRLSRLSRTDAPGRSASGSKPPPAPVMMAGADMLPADVQQQIRVEQLLRTLSRSTESGDGEAVSDGADREASPKPRPPRWRPGQPEGEAVRDGEPGVDFDLSDEKATLTHLPQWKTGRSLTATSAGEDASSILMQLDLPAAASATDKTQERADRSDADAPDSPSESAFASMEEINEALASDMVPLETTAGYAGRRASPVAAAQPPVAETTPTAETGQPALTVYEEMVELKQPSTAFQYDDLGFEDSAQDTGGRLGREYHDTEGSDSRAAGRQKNTARTVSGSDGRNAPGQTATFSAPKKPWYRKIFSRKQQRTSSAPVGETPDGSASVEDVAAAMAAGMADMPDVDEETAAQQAEDRLAAVWQNSSDWMPAESSDAVGQQVYDGIDLCPDMNALGALRSRPDTGESMLGFLRHLYRQVTALKRAGDTGRARALLLEHLMVMPATSAWVYLEFLALTDVSSSDTLVVSGKFKEQFNRFPPVDRARVPGLAVRPKTLMEYDQALHSLSNVWLQEQARDLLDRWLAGYASNMRLFSLHAYRELFLLYEILDDALAAGGGGIDDPAEVDIALF